MEEKKEKLAAEEGRLISVIVPVYNVELYLRQCIESILAQTYSCFELILVDDGSPDRCGEICDEYAQKDSRIRVIHQENQGQAGARNTALNTARGTYITFVDSDDVVDKTYLQNLKHVMNEDVDITVCKFKHFIFETELTNVNNTGTPIPIYYNAESAAVAVFNGVISAGPCGKLYRSEVLCDIRFPVGRIHEDVVFTPIACYAARKIAVTNERLYFYREHQNSTIHSKFSLKRYDAIWAVDQCVSFFESKGEDAIVNAAMKKRQYYLATYRILAYRDKVRIPKEFRIGILEALSYIRKNSDDNYFQYYLSMVHPRLAVLHEYWMKIKRMLSFKRK